jgi:hypothetical protein
MKREVEAPAIPGRTASGAYNLAELAAYFKACTDLGIGDERMARELQVPLDRVIYMKGRL